MKGGMIAVVAVHVMAWLQEHAIDFNTNYWIAMAEIFACGALVQKYGLGDRCTRIGIDGEPTFNLVDENGYPTREND